ncbi:solid-state culture-specific ATP-grasp domain protein [Aspergillus costaricaensis CBS 115574]|uniref:Solid-state culture-specific ATP-grasp domain protein n=1 Tax=Aspergillus costaricaensis CBS 115574 TaxID=1448317 RepID=A0ACD1IQ11_9EURO|nr:solid-state culture-specific ATP-grasp domain protein [Aspergillus costaricaensis CBS 115574]RAK91787.1 solid-state culture-specific ATP-grasp domain protein [Aspergillus costaricaensis CBS 115574]
MTAVTLPQPLPVVPPEPYSSTKTAITKVPITLDCTLHDLYSLDNDTPENIVLAYDHPCKFPHDQLNSSPYPRFLYAANFPDMNAEGEMPNLQKRGVAQRYSFVAGRTPVLMIDLSGNGGEEVSSLLTTSKDELRRLYDQLSPEQRPNAQIVRSTHDVQLTPDSRAVLIVPHDHMCAMLNQALEPEMLYEILSKRWLAVSGLPTPKSKVIDPLPVNSWIAGRDAEVRRMLQAVQQQSFPFVVKISIATSGCGTFVIRRESDRGTAINEIRGLLEDGLKKFNEENEQLYPASFVIQELVPGEAHGVTFFVTKKGRAVYLATSQQRFTQEGFWNGGCVSYLLQPMFQDRYRSTIEVLAKALHNKGYYGPVGADVMTDANGEHVIVDVNPRVTGSYHLGLLKTHFMQRGLCEAAVLSRLDIPCTQNAFEELFATDIAQGRLIINAWVTDSKKESSHAVLTVGAEDAVKLGRLIRVIETFVKTGEYAESAEL